MRKKEKIGVAFAMSLGILYVFPSDDLGFHTYQTTRSAGAAVIVKTCYLVKLSEKADFTCTSRYPALTR
jgi:hypothetical protein